MSAEPVVAEADVTSPVPCEPAATLDLAAVVAGGHIVVNGPDGQPLAAVVPLSVLDEITRLRELVEDQEDVIAALESVLHQLESGEEPRPWAEVRAELGLDDAEEALAATESR